MESNLGVYLHHQVSRQQKSFKAFVPAVVADVVVAGCEATVEAMAKCLCRTDLPNPWWTWRRNFRRFRASSNRQRRRSLRHRAPSWTRRSRRRTHCSWRTTARSLKHFWAGNSLGRIPKFKILLNAEFSRWFWPFKPSDANMLNSITNLPNTKFRKNLQTIWNFAKMAIYFQNLTKFVKKSASFGRLSWPSYIS